MPCVRHSSPFVRMPNTRSPSSTKANLYLTPSSTSKPNSPKSSLRKMSTNSSHSLPSNLLSLIPGVPMANVSMANPFSSVLPVAQTDPRSNLSLSLSGQETGQKQKGQNFSVPAQFLALVAALGSLSSVALSSARVLPVYHLFPTPLRPGDSATLENR